MRSRRQYNSSPPAVTVIGGGLAGCEAAHQIARRGLPVRLVEMRPESMTPAHSTPELAELVCSNSFKSEDPTTATGQLKRELALMGSLILREALNHRVPAGGALAVDRVAFSSAISELVAADPLITVDRSEATSIPEGYVIIATGPLTSPGFEGALSRVVGADRLAFFDAAAPVIDAESIDMSVAFRQSRYDKGDSADYINCPMSRPEYERFISELTDAELVTKKSFERSELFNACQPIEEIARTGIDAPRFGALKPIGLQDPRTGDRPWAVVQLRAENRAATAYNIVGFQTNLTFPEQRRVFSLVPALKDAVFLRYGVMHRNTYVDSPRLLDATLALRTGPRVRLAGQLTGTEGYLEAAASGLLAGLNTVAAIQSHPPVVLPDTTSLGALIAYATDPDTGPYQPMHVNWGLVPPLVPAIRGKRQRYAAYAERAYEHVFQTVTSHPLTADEHP